MCVCIYKFTIAQAVVKTNKQKNNKAKTFPFPNPLNRRAKFSNFQMKEGKLYGTVTEYTRAIPN